MEGFEKEGHIAMNFFGTLTIDPNEFKKGKSRGVTFRCNPHENKKKNTRRHRREWKKNIDV